MTSPSSSQYSSHIGSHQNNFSAIRTSTRAKLGSEEKQHSSHSSHSNVRLGDYVRQRKYSKDKQIGDHFKSAQLMGEDDQMTRDLKFRKQNVNRLYDKIATQIHKRREELADKSHDQLIKEQIFMDEVFKMIIGTKPGDLYGKQASSTQTTTVSTAPYNISKKYIGNTFSDNQTRTKTESQRPIFKYQKEQKILDDSFHQEEKVSDRIQKLLDRYRSKDRSTDKEIVKKTDQNKGLGSASSKHTSSSQNIRMMRPPPIPKK